LTFNKAATCVHSIAMIFAPTLKEQENEEEKIQINNWRQAFLQNLSSMDTDTANNTWNKIRAYLKESLVQYENINIRNAQSERTERVNTAITSVISQRFPENPTAQARARKFIDMKREAFSFPALEEMYEDFGIN
jgi:hypothetical protein